MFEHLKVGDKVTRLLCGTIPMNLTVSKIENGLIFCQVPGTSGKEEGDFWTFDPKTGAEVDEDFNSGPPPKYPYTVSFLAPETYVTKNTCPECGLIRDHRKGCSKK